MWKSDGDDDDVKSNYGDCNDDVLIITSSLMLDLERNNWCHLKWKSNGDGDADDIGCNDDFDDDDLTRFIVIIIIRPRAQ